MKIRKRRHFSHEERVRILRAHFDDGVGMRKLGERHGIHPTVLHRWKRELLARLADRPGTSLPPARSLELRRRLRTLDARIARLHVDLADLRHQLREFEGETPRVTNGAWVGETELSP